jgi:hypothetical protein
MNQSLKPSFQKTAQRSVAVYLEPRFEYVELQKAGFHLAFACAQLDGMTGVRDDR